MHVGLVGNATVTAGLVAVAAVAAIGAWVAVWLRKSDNTLRLARRAIERGDQRTALALLGRIRPAASATSRPWHAEQRHLEGECLYAAAEIALRDRQFADALEHYKAVAGLLGMAEAEATNRVIEAMLAEARRLSAAAPDGPALPVLLDLILDRQSSCPEASFWLGLFHLRHKNTAAGIAALETAHAATEGRQIDPALYLGVVWLREGKPREALRVLSEANRLAPTCPLVSFHLGAALTESGGDALLALRALQKATDGLPKYLRAPHRLWADTLPADSWVRNLAQRAGTQRTQFQCPLGLDRVEPLLQRARLALGEAMVTCDRAEEAVAVFTDLLKTRDDLPVRRGLGLALAQLGEWDGALPHLRVAYAAEKPPSPATTGAAAMCLVHASGDRVNNVRNALGLIASLNVRADAAWARRAGAVFAAAKAAGVPVSAPEVAELADVLASTDAADPTAAAVYDLLAATRLSGISAASNKVPDILLSCARLYVRAAQRHNVNLSQDEKLFDLAMTDRRATRRYYADREWDFDVVERLYLDRWATRRPGSFPAAPGPNYATEAGAALLADARRLVKQNRPDGARDVAKLVLKLNPTSGPAYDLLAEIAYRRGDGTDAIDRLKAWHGVCPADPVPLARLAVLAVIDHRPGEALATVRQALNNVRGAARVQYLLLAARLALAAGKPADALSLFDECLGLSPEHPTALAGRAALAWANGDFPTLVGLADRMAIVPAEDPWFHYLTGAATLLAGQLNEAEVSAKHAAADPATAAEGRHLLALVRDRRNDSAGAADLLQDPAVASGAAADHAVALRGQAAWRGGDFGEAMRCWQGLPDARLKTWNLATLMGGTAFLAGLQALRTGNAEEAATWLRQAVRLGYVDPRLESLLTIASTRAGTGSHGVDLLEQAIEAGGTRTELSRHLARAYRRAGRIADARRLLDRAPANDASLALERGLLALAEGQIVPAEKAFAAALAVFEPPQSNPTPQGGREQEAAAAMNLVFTRLSLGRVAEAAALMPRAADLAPTYDLTRLLTLLNALATDSTTSVTDWVVDDDRALIDCLRSLGRIESVAPLFDVLSATRGQSPDVKKAAAELLPLRAKARIDRGGAAAARELLEAHVGPYMPALLRNLLGVVACFHQDFQRAVPHFQAALPPVGDDARVQQNLALVRGWLGDTERSNAHWRRYLEVHAAQMPKPPGMADYHRRLVALVRERLRISSEEFALPRSAH
jgi:tetratricopeptide (TPR) repeat protein